MMMLKKKWIGALLTMFVLLCACDANQVETPLDESTVTPMPTPSETTAPAQESIPPSEPVETTPEPTGPIMLEEIVGLIPECEPVEEEWFKDAVFIGDSRTDGLRLYGGIKGAKFFSYAGLSVFSIGDKKCIPLNGEKVTVLDALSRGEYKKIFVMLGINELGYKDLKAFKQAYTDLILRIREMHPEADIYVQLQPPANEKVAKEKKNYAHVTNERILLFNELIAEVAEEQKTALLDIWDALVNENGELPANVTADGVHMIRAGYLIWADYLRCHTGATPLVPEGVEKEDVPTETPEESAPSQSVQPSAQPGTPVSSAPVPSTPVPSAPVTSEPVSSAPVTTAPVMTAPVITTPPASDSPAVSAPPVLEAPVETVMPSQPVESTPVESTPVETTAPVESAAPEVSAPVESAPGADVGMNDDPEAVIDRMENGDAE